MATIQLAQLLEAGVHFGHKANRWNPKMFPYIYAERDGIHILDLVQTAQLLNKACIFANSEIHSVCPRLRNIPSGVRSRLMSVEFSTRLIDKLKSYKSSQTNVCGHV